MTKQERDFLAILKNTIHSDVWPLQNIESDLEDILLIAKKQNLFPLVFDAMDGLPGYEDLEFKYFNTVAASMSNQAQKTEDFLDLYRAFLKDELSPIVLKGIVCRQLYGDKCDLRPSGDEDILIEKKDYDKAVQVMKKSGYVPNELPDKNLDIVQEVTFESSETNLSIELHLNPFGFDDDRRAKLNDWFKDVYDSKETVDIKGVSVRTLEPTDHMLFLIFHAFKHFIFGGFGVRLMLDILLYAETYYERIVWHYVSEGLEGAGAADFYADLVDIGNRYLGFKLPVIGATNCPDELIDDMFQMGTFGNSNKKQ